MGKHFVYMFPKLGLRNIPMIVEFVRSEGVQYGCFHSRHVYSSNSNIMQPGKRMRNLTRSHTGRSWKSNPRSLRRHVKVERDLEID
jgi:hypothetical protein